MEFNELRRRKKPKLMIIPMIDIIFFLLVFFMMNMLSMVNQNTIAVNLPTAQSASADLNERISVTINSEGVVYLGKKVTTKQELNAFLQEAKVKNSAVSVLLNADEQVAHGKVVAVIDVIKTAGINNMVMAVQRAGG